MKKKFDISNLLAPLILLIVLALTIMFIPEYARYVFPLIVIFLLYTKRYIVYAFQGSKAYNMKNFTYALERYRKSVKVSGCKGAIVTSYLIVEIKYGKPSLALDYINKNMNNKKFDEATKYSMSVSKAIALWKENMALDSLNLLKDLLKTSENTYAYETLTTLLIMNKNYDEALEYIKKGLDYNKDSKVLLSNEAEVYYKLGNFQKSEELFKPLIESKVNFAEPYYYTGLLAKERGEREKAIELLEKVIDCNDSLLTTVSKEETQEILGPLYDEEDK
ncbi:MAG: tetratricopeptide repeat protein [Clostridium sp.]|jgi:tetratricopeptide (TPR) repeat protein